MYVLSHDGRAHLIDFFLPICLMGFYKSALFDFVSFVILRLTRVEIALSAFDRLYHSQFSLVQQNIVSKKSFLSKFYQPSDAN